MKKWEAALDKFLERYLHQPWFEGALLSGSYACGNQNKFSDIDVTIIGSNDLNWQEKSNCYVDGFLIEYIINPIWRFEKYMDESLKDHDYTSQNLILYGKILFDVISFSKIFIVQNQLDFAMRNMRQIAKIIISGNQGINQKPILQVDMKLFVIKRLQFIIPIP